MPATSNSAHPFENPNPWSNLVEIFLLLVIPVSLTRAFCVMVDNKKQGYTLWSVMAVLWSAMLGWGTVGADWRCAGGNREPGSAR